MPPKRLPKRPKEPAPPKEKPPEPRLRARVWVQLDGQSAPALSDAGADLLEQIEAAGSLSEAARRLHYAYRRAWLLIDTMNRSWGQPLVKTTAGGPRGGGAKLTPHGQAILTAYRDVQLQIEHAIDQATPNFQAATHPTNAK